MRQLMVVGLLGIMLAVAVRAGAESDPSGDTLGSGGIDVTALDACQSATSVVIEMTFAGTISPPTDDDPPADALFGYIDVDVDADGETGNMSHVDQYGPPEAGTELGIEASIEIPSWDPVSQTMAFEPTVGESLRIPATFTANALKVVVPLPDGSAPSVHLGAVVGNFQAPTDVVPNTGFVTAVSCCGNGVVDPGEDCDGGECCSATCTFAANGTLCTDGDACTVQDTCTAGSCGGGTRDCDDADPCYDDSCDPAAGCMHVSRTGFPGVTCAFARTLPTLCSGQTVATAKLDKAGTLVGQAASATGAKQKKLVKKARKTLKAMGRLIAKAQKKDKLTIECAEGIQAQLDDIGKRLDAAVGG